MDHAFCNLDNNEWEADKFYQLPKETFNLYKRNLTCLGCNGVAWFRKSSFGKMSPHFCAHHEEDCNYASVYTVLDQGDGEGTIPATDPDSGIVLNLGLENDYSIDVAPKNVDGREGNPPKLGGSVTSGSGINYPAHHTLKNTLFQLVRSKGEFANKGQNVRVNDKNNLFNLPSIDRELFVEFKNVSPYLDGSDRIYWGFISDAGTSPNGTIWLNAGQRSDGLSIRIHADIVDQFREYFKVDAQLSNLDGCYALIIGPCIYSASTRKPVIWCSSLDFIVLRRYNFE
jgi:hypothetical protein